MKYFFLIFFFSLNWFASKGQNNQVPLKFDTLTCSQVISKNSNDANGEYPSILKITDKQLLDMQIEKRDSISHLQALSHLSYAGANLITMQQKILMGFLIQIAGALIMASGQDFLPVGVAFIGIGGIVQFTSIWNMGKAGKHLKESAKSF